MPLTISNTFLESYSGIPRAQQKKVLSFLTDFQRDRRSPGVHYEPVQSARDKSMYSARIDQTYRAIIVHPGEDVFVMAWVDHHDQAYAWAASRRAAVNPDTGALQLINLDEVAAPAPASEAAALPPAFFEGLRERTLRRLGIPGELVPRVRAIRTEGELWDSAEWLPEEAHNALLSIRTGDSADALILERETEAVVAAPAPAPDDFLAALDNADSLQRFHTVTSEEDLQALLDAPLQKWRVFLHPLQRRLTRIRSNGPVRVLGGAGTGKTVVALHRARFLADEVFTGTSDRILFTTFNRHMAADIKSSLVRICSAATLERIEVIYLDAWVKRFLEMHGRPATGIFPSQGNDAWKRAMELTAPAFTAEFLMAEWEQVIQAQGIETIDAYLAATREGRGERLPADARRRAWTFFQAYRMELDRTGQREFIDLIREARRIIEQKGLRLPYRAVIVDEAQDMSPEALRLVRALVPEGPDDLFIVGDAHQRIYRYRAILGRCGIDVRGRGHRLKINYRTTEEIRGFAMDLLKDRRIDDLDGGSDTHAGYVSLTRGQAPEVQCFENEEMEMAAALRRIRNLLDGGAPPESICLAARIRRIFASFQAYVSARGVTTFEIQGEAGDFEGAPGVRIASLHRVKGLEFDHMLVVGAKRGVIPLVMAMKAADDALDAEETETAERALLYVALTRARRTCYVSASGALTSFLGGDGRK